MTANTICRVVSCRWGATYLQQLRILFVRSLKTRRFESLSVQDMLQLVIVALLSGQHASGCMQVLV
jgi:hypothetical protein